MPTVKGRSKKGQFKKGSKGGPGRPKGAKGKISLDFVIGMQETFYKLGGVKWLVEFANKSNENGRTFVRVMAQFIPSQTLSIMLAGEVAKRELVSGPRIEFVQAEVPALTARVVQLERLLEEHEIALPEPDKSLALPEHREFGQELAPAGISPPDEGQDTGEEAPQGEDPVESWVLERAEREKKRQEAIKKLTQAQREEDDDSWAVTKNG